jgi:hypothetical protein
MKIIRITPRKLHNAEWFSFYSEFGECVEEFGADAIGIGKLYDRFALLYRKTDRLIVVLRKSVHTKELKEADKRRDSLVKGLYSIVKGWRAYPDDNRQEAAERLYILLKKYQEIILAGNRISESGAIYNLLQDLRGSYAPGIALLELTGWVKAIDEAEQKFLAINAERTEERVEKPKENLRQLRRQADVLYTAMTEAVDARLLADGLGGNVATDPDDDVHPETEENPSPEPSYTNVPFHFVMKWNEIVKRYRNFLAQRAGRKAGETGL